MARTVFICHSSKDKLVADAACAALEAQRIPCWIAPRDVLGGTLQARGPGWAGTHSSHAYVPGLSALDFLGLLT